MGPWANPWFPMVPMAPKGMRSYGAHEAAGATGSPTGALPPRGPDGTPY